MTEARKRRCKRLPFILTLNNNNNNNNNNNDNNNNNKGERNIIIIINNFIITIMVIITFTKFRGRAISTASSFCSHYRHDLCAQEKNLCVE